MKTYWNLPKWGNVLIHAGFWIVLFSMPYLLRPAYNSHERPAPEANAGLVWHHLTNALALMALFYTNAFVLIPRFLNHRRYRTYFASLLGAILVFALLNRISFRLQVPQLEFQLNSFILFNFFSCLFMIAGSTAYRMLRDKAQSDREAQERETENLKTELLFLRSQISPHFLFNVLNSVVALSRKKSDQVEPTLIRLSSLLRYMLYETGEKEVLLEKEIEYLQSYVNLQQQRFGKKLSVTFEVPAIDRSYLIEPMLLVPFVENAFKYGTALVEQAEIVITLQAGEGILNFCVRNRYNPEYAARHSDPSGIGLANVKRRLDLLYQDQYSLDVERNKNHFSVSLQIKLH